MRNIPHCLVNVAAGAVTVLVLATPVRAQVEVTDPNLPVVYPDGVYRTPVGVFASYLSGLVLTDIELRALVPVNRGPSGLTEIENFNSQMLGLVFSGGPFVPASGSGPVTTEVFGKIGNATGIFSTEMLSMNLIVTSSLGTSMIRESPTVASLGQTTVADIGGGQYRIDSFFDIFTESSLDGGQTWTPSQSSTHVDLQGQGVPETGGTVVLLLISLSVLGLCQMGNKFSRCPAG